MHLPGSAWLLGVVLAAVSLGGSLGIARSANPTRRLLFLLFALLGLLAAMQYAVKFAGTGVLDNIKLLLLFNALMDLCLIFAVAWAFERWLPGRSHPNGDLASERPWRRASGRLPSRKRDWGSSSWDRSQLRPPGPPIPSG